MHLANFMYQIKNWKKYSKKKKKNFTFNLSTQFYIIPQNLHELLLARKLMIPHPCAHCNSDSQMKYIYFTLSKQETVIRRTRGTKNQKEHENLGKQFRRSGCWSIKLLDSAACRFLLWGGHYQCQRDARGDSQPGTKTPHYWSAAVNSASAGLTGAPHPLIYGQSGSSPSCKKQEEKQIFSPGRWKRCFGEHGCGDTEILGENPTWFNLSLWTYERTRWQVRSGEFQHHFKNISVNIIIFLREI